MLGQLDTWLDGPDHTGWVVARSSTWDQPEVIAASLAAQIEALFPALRDADARPERRLIELLGQVSKQLDAPRRLVVLVDGFDETDAGPGENPLPRFLPHALGAAARDPLSVRDPAEISAPDWTEARNSVRRPQVRIRETRGKASPLGA